jgi:ribosomal 30S subunit maturation factor RimM
MCVFGVVIDTVGVQSELRICKDSDKLAALFYSRQTGRDADTIAFTPRT